MSYVSDGGLTSVFFCIDVSNMNFEVAAFVDTSVADRDQTMDYLPTLFCCPC